LLACSIAEPCQPVSAGTAECPTLTVESLACFVEHLRDRAPGRYRYDWSSCSAIGTAWTKTTILVQEDGRVMTASCKASYDGKGACGEAMLCSLPSPETLDACLATKAQWSGSQQPTCAALNSLLLDCKPVATSCE
jgi:hypothetical protein